MVTSVKVIIQPNSIPSQGYLPAQSAGAVEYTDCISDER